MMDKVADAYTALRETRSLHRPMLSEEVKTKL